jgi:predicted Zn-dependent peptidase
MRHISNLVIRKRLWGLAGVLLAALAIPAFQALAQTGQFAPSDSAASAAPADSAAAPVQEWKERVMPELPDRPRVPIYDPGLPVQRKVLKNGVVLMVQEQRTSDQAAAMVSLRMGTQYEDDRTSGLSQVVMRALTAGTKKLSPADVQLHVSARRVKLESNATADYAQIGFETVREEAPAALDLLAQMVLSPSFPDTSVESARHHFLARAAEDVENPLLATYTTFLSTMYRGSPLARPPHGTVQALSEARRSDVLAHYAKFFVGGNMAVAVVGNVDGKKVMAQLEKLFAAAPPGPRASPMPGEPQPPASDTTIVSERPILARSLVYGYPAPGYADPDYAAMMIVDSYLRSADRSPITFWLPQREQAGSVGVMFPSYPRRSSIAIYLAAPSAKYEAARDTVAAVFERIKTEPFDKGEWGVQLKRVHTAFFWKQNEPVLRARNLSRWEIQGVTTDHPRNFETALLKLKPEDVRDAAARWFTSAVEVSIQPSGRDGQP